MPSFEIYCFSFCKCFSVFQGIMVWLSPCFMPPLYLPKLCFLCLPAMNPIYYVPHSQDHFISLAPTWLRNFRTPGLNSVSYLPHHEKHIHPSLTSRTPGSPDGCTFCFLISTAPSSTWSDSFPSSTKTWSVDLPRWSIVHPSWTTL